ncbi:MAG: DUF2177 family protein [Thermoflexales bacterium]|nr:DUF2177 family protein [Thermoflexales bacterium]
MKSRFLPAYLVTLVVFLVLDGLWLGLVAQSLYQSQLGALMSKTPLWAAAVLFYLLYIVGLVVFVVAPALRTGGPRSAALHGALFGLVAYATYDLTNLATLNGWPVTITLIDLVWGATVTAASSALAVLILSRRKTA